MRFLADENVSRLVIEQPRARGFDVMSVGETRSGAPDSDVLEAADAGGCILITEDRDFGQLVIRQRLVVGGMICWSWIASRMRWRLTQWPRSFRRTRTSSWATSS